jgi:hypothetical protein
MDMTIENEFLEVPISHMEPDSVATIVSKGGRRHERTYPSINTGAGAPPCALHIYNNTAMALLPSRRFEHLFIDV